MNNKFPSFFPSFPYEQCLIMPHEVDGFFSNRLTCWSVCLSRLLVKKSVFDANHNHLFQRLWVEILCWDIFYFPCNVDPYWTLRPQQEMGVHRYCLVSIDVFIYICIIFAEQKLYSSLMYHVIFYDFIYHYAG